MPLIAMDLWREVSPRTIRTAERGHPRISAKNRTRASLAAESTGGAVTLIFNSLPTASQTSLRDARGCTFTESSTVPSNCLRRNGGGFIISAALDLEYEPGAIRSNG